MVFGLYVRMLYILVLCPALLASAVLTLSIDSQLGTSIEDCFERVSIGDQLPHESIYRNVSELMIKECEQICKQDKQCQAFDYGVGAKGNATCDLSNLDEKEIKEKNLLQRNPDYDVYIRRILCEQSPPTPIKEQINDPDKVPQHRPVVRPEEDERRPFDDLNPYESSRPLPSYTNRPNNNFNQINERPDGYSPGNPDYDRPPSYGVHKPPDLPYRPSIPYNHSRPDSYDTLYFQDNRKPRPDFWRPDPYHPVQPGDDIEDVYGPKPSRPQKPQHMPEKPQYQYIIRPNKRPYKPINEGHQSYPENSAQNPYSPISEPSRPIRPPSNPYRPTRPYDKPSYTYTDQYASNYGNQDNSIYVEIYDPPRPYRPDVNERPYNGNNYGTSSQSYGQNSYSSQHSYSQNQVHYGSSSSHENYQHGVRPEKPSANGYVPRPGKPSANGYGPRPEEPSSNGYGTRPEGPSSNGYGNRPENPNPSGYHEPNEDIGYGARPTNKPGPLESNQGYNNQHSQNSNQGGYGENQSSNAYFTQESSQGYGDQNSHNQAFNGYGNRQPLKENQHSNDQNHHHQNGYGNEVSNGYGQVHTSQASGYGQTSYGQEHSTSQYASNQSGYGSQVAHKPRPNPNGYGNQPTMDKPISNGGHRQGEEYYSGYGQGQSVAQGMHYGTSQTQMSQYGNSQGSYNSQTLGSTSHSFGQSGYYGSHLGYGIHHLYGIKPGSYEKPNQRPSDVPNNDGYGKKENKPMKNPVQDDPNDKQNRRPGSDRPLLKPHETERERPGLMLRPNDEIITSKPVAISDNRRRPENEFNYEACFRRVLAGRRAVRSHVRRVVDCERLEDCRRECATEKRFPCESFNYRLDPTFRGKGLCELMTKPIEAFDLQQDFVADKDYDFYEVDRNSLEPYCPETLRGPGLLHSGYLSSKPDKAASQNQWRDRNWSANDHRSYNRFYNEKKSHSFNRRYEDQFYVPYQIGMSRSDDDKGSWGQYGGSYGSVDSYYKDRNDYHKSISHWGLKEHGAEYHRDDGFNYNSLRRDHEDKFNYNSLRRHGEENFGYGYGAWKKGRWNNSGSFWRDDTSTKFESDEADENVKDCSSRRRAGMSLGAGAVRRSLRARTVVDCEAACFGEREFKCVSYSYRYSSSPGSDNCYLSERPYKGLDMSTDSGSDVYAMPLHHDCLTISTKPWVESECFWHVRSGAALRGPSVRASLTVGGLGACEAECIRAHGFFCRGFSFRYDPPTIGDDLENCLLTSSPPTTLELNHGLQPNKHELYARGNYGRGCEPALYDDANHEPQCYLQYAQSARLSRGAVRGAARSHDERACGRACTDAPFRCLSFSYTNNAPPNTDNCLLSEIRLFDLHRGVDYEHSTDDLLFAFDLFNGQCWRKVHGRNDYEVPTLEVPHPIQIEESYPLTASGPDSPPPSEIYISGSGPSGPPAIKPYISEPEYKPGPVKPYPESGEVDYKPFEYPEPGYGPYYKPSRPEYVPEKPIIIDGYRPSSPSGPASKPSYGPSSGPSVSSYDSSGSGYGVSSGSSFSQSIGSSLSHSSGASYSSSSNIASGSSYGGDEFHIGSAHGGSAYGGSSSGSAYGSSGGATYGSSSGSGYGSSIGSAYDSSSGSGYGSSSGSAYGSSSGSAYGSSSSSSYSSSSGSAYGSSSGSGHGSSGGYAENRPYPAQSGHRPNRPISGDRVDDNLSLSWRHYTVSGFPCRRGTACERNLIAGHWACEPEGGEIGSWDYCCAPTHRCGYSEGFRKPWCYVGPATDQWRPCSEKYYPYHQHNIPHPSQGQRESERPRPDTSKKTYAERDRLSTGYLSTADRRYWDDLYENGPQAYYDKHGNPLPGYSRVPTESRPHIKYERNPPLPGSGQWVPVNTVPNDELPPPGLGVARYWPVAYLHKGPPPNMTYFRYNETERTTRSPQEQRTTTDKAAANDIEGRSGDYPRSEKRINITNDDSDYLDQTTIKTVINETHENITEREIKNDTEVKKYRVNSKIEDDYIKGIDGKLHDFAKSLEIFDIEDVRSDKLTNLRSLEAEEKQIEAIGRLVAARRGGKILIQKRSETDLQDKNIALDKDFVDFNFGNKFPTERRGVIQKVSKDDIEILKDKSLELSETTFVRPPRVLSTTENIRKAIFNGKVFYDASIRNQRDLFANSTRRSKNLRLEPRGPPVTGSGNTKKKNIRTRNTNPVRRAKRVYRKRYNPEEVRKRLLEREKNKNATDAS